MKNAPDRVRSPWHAAAAAVLAGLLFTGVLVAVAREVRESNDRDLLRQRTREAAAVVQAAIPTLGLPLATASAVAEATDGDPRTFRELFRPLTTETGPFVGATLWRKGAWDAPVAEVGARLELVRGAPGRRAGVLGRAPSGTFSVVNLLGGSDRRLGYATAAPRSFVVYAEQKLSAQGRLPAARDAAFADLGYALYLGSEERDADLLFASLGDHVPLPAPRAREVVAFGDTSLLLVMTPHEPLGGSLLARLPWVLAAGGVLVTLMAATLVARLARRRHDAERLVERLNTTAAENEALYRRQREIAETLQHSLLPEAFPHLPGLEASGRYVAGVTDVEIGGDWYDVVSVGHRSVLFAIGDVSGRGVRAGTIMAKLRYAVRAYGVEGDAPDVVLGKVSRLLNVSDGYFATLLCGVLDLEAGVLTLGNAGHLPPLIGDASGWRYLETQRGVPVGVTGAGYRAVDVALADEGTLVVFTDGLVERRGEMLDVGLERLRELAEHGDGDLEALLDAALSILPADGCDDDAAVLALRWRR
jgi:serine phosphatase RsbU (regulator of sigma subunit)